jgi:hypothetical protein
LTQHYQKQLKGGCQEEQEEPNLEVWCGEGQEDPKLEECGEELEEL